MEKRIKIVWTLTIITALLIIGGQSYWLYNQYCYSADEHMRSLHKQILQLETEEFETRYKDRSIQTPMTISYQFTLPDSASSQGETSCSVFFHTNQKDSNQINIDPKNAIRKDTFVVKNASNETILQAASRYSTELGAPLKIKTLDSLFRNHGILATDIRKVNLDTLQWKGTYRATHQLFPPVMLITYPYNPLQKQAITAFITVPVHPLLQQMSWQLSGSLLLILLLIFCLIYQIKTILKQKRIDEMRKSFVNTMIHELKRPVQTLKMCVAFLNNKSMRTDEQAMDEVLKDSMFELDNLSAYLVKVKDMTHADYEHTPLNIRTFDLCETVDKLIRLHNAPTDKQVTIHPHYEMESPLVTADPVHLANIISNLIENAIKYSGKEVYIELFCMQKGHTLTIRITDNGIGIYLPEQGKVFDKFYRGNNIPDRNIPGIGLGLSYVKLLTEAHHGLISLTSQPGKGTTFTIVLPQ